MTTSKMNEEYANYLQSGDWLKRRQQKLDASGSCCESCGKSNRLQVHHLTYARIFQELPSDLMVLCRYHHIAAEESVSKGEIKRFGDTALLREQTLDVLATYGKSVNGKRRDGQRRSAKLERRAERLMRRKNNLILPDRKSASCNHCGKSHPLFYIETGNSGIQLGWLCSEYRKILCTKTVLGLPIETVTRATLATANQ